jgi:hypothetical protein
VILPNLLDQPIAHRIGLQHIDGVVQREFADRPQKGAVSARSTKHSSGSMRLIATAAVMIKTAGFHR